MVSRKISEISAFLNTNSSLIISYGKPSNNYIIISHLLVILFTDAIPDEMKALRVAAPMSTVAGMLPPTNEWPSNVVNMVQYYFFYYTVKLSLVFDNAVADIFILAVREIWVHIFVTFLL